MELTEVERERLAKLEQLRASGIEPYPLRSQFVRQRVLAADAVRQALASAQSQADGAAGDDAPPEVAVMGRVVARRSGHHDAASSSADIASPTTRSAPE